MLHATCVPNHKVRDTDLFFSHCARFFFTRLSLCRGGVARYAPADRDVMWKVAAALKKQGMHSFNADMLTQHESHQKVSA